MAKLTPSTPAHVLATTSAGRTALRVASGLSRTDTCATIVLVDGCSSPRRAGERGGFFTRGGTPIDHPGAYSRRGWSNMVYQTSSLRVVVGRDWSQAVQGAIAAQALGAAYLEMARAA